MSQELDTTILKIDSKNILYASEKIILQPAGKIWLKN